MRASLNVTPYSNAAACMQMQVGANLGKSGYMAEITRATSDINVQVRAHTHT
jgi:hypothetical protein